MIPGLNSREMLKAMKKLGIKQEDIDALEVIIRCSDKDIIVRNPEVLKVNMTGKETFQVRLILGRLFGLNTILTGIFVYFFFTVHSVGNKFHINVCFIL